MLLRFVDLSMVAEFFERRIFLGAVNCTQVGFVESHCTHADMQAISTALQHLVDMVFHICVGLLELLVY